MISAGNLYLEAAVAITTFLLLGRYLVTNAQAGKAQVQRLADRISAIFVRVVIALAV